MAKRIITCRNKRRKQRADIEASWPACQGYPCVYTHLAEHWTNDVVRCDCPVKLKYGERVEHITERWRKIRRAPRKPEKADNED